MDTEEEQSDRVECPAVRAGLVRGTEGARGWETGHVGLNFPSGLFYELCNLANDLVSHFLSVK